jgi:hypothetical protein
VSYSVFEMPGVGQLRAQRTDSVVRTRKTIFPATRPYTMICGPS